MGWWKINSPGSGGIDRAHATGSRLLNAVPGRHTPENHYNGDRPADAMGNAVDRVLTVMSVAQPGPGSKDALVGVSREELLDLFLAQKVPAWFSGDGATLLGIVSACWAEVDAEYGEDWDRRAYLEEREAVCNFVLNPLFV